MIFHVKLIRHTFSTYDFDAAYVFVLHATLKWTYY